MATNDKEDERMDTQGDNTRGYEDLHDDGLNPQNMEYNGNQLNSRDRNRGKQDHIQEVNRIRFGIRI